MLEVTKKNIVKTRKAHECYGCCKIIDKGAAAVNVRGKEDEQYIQFHLHVQCHILIMKQKLFNENFSKGAVNKIRNNNYADSAEGATCPY
ncbi:hypothetical protein [Solibacillus sp. FSL K6-1523]|uniref:hypothetical protein n=1 Tax=Solibacillus sp. FSL K6-1523 TaxID=2921471 RepID=UPI0030F8A437